MRELFSGVMKLTIEIPDDLSEELARAWRDLPRAALEAIVQSAYRDGIVSRFQVGSILGLTSRFEVDEYLHHHGVYRNYSIDDFESDLATLRCAS
jgi:Uncharacterised protein family (UPF0175)